LTDYWKSTNCELRFLRSNPRTRKPEYFIPASETELLDTNWLDLVASSFNWDFPNGEKNEKLIQRVLSMVTAPNDWVMDCFLGSGTTAAVAHKMNRKWIGIEMGEQMLTHSQPRLKAVCEGLDNKGISKDVNWQGGGGFRFFST
jgi:adenine-specific DNA-methyltransferase